MNQNWIIRYWWAPVLFAGMVLSSFTLFEVSDPGSVSPPAKQFNVIYAQLKDTVPSKEEEEDDDRGWSFNFKTGELDKAIGDMEREIIKAKTEFKNKDWKRIDEELKRAMQELEKVDMSKIRKDLELSLSKVNLDKMEAELRQSLKTLEEVELPKMKQELHENLSKQLAETERQLQHSKQELLMQQERMKGDIGKKLEETMKNLDKSLEGAKAQLKEFKTMTTEMEKDGLIKKGENAEIKYKDGELYINGKKQPKEITDKYKHYFKKGTVHLNFNDDDDWI